MPRLLSCRMRRVTSERVSSGGVVGSSVARTDAGKRRKHLPGGYLDQLEIGRRGTNLGRCGLRDLHAVQETRASRA